MAERLFSANQVADLLGVQPAEVADWARSGQLSFRRRFDGSIGVPEKELVQFLERKGIDLTALMTQVLSKEGDVDQDKQSLPARPAPEAPQAIAARAAPAPPSTAAKAVEEAALSLLREALARRAQGILIETGGEGATVRLKVDGTLADCPAAVQSQTSRCLDYFKALAGIDAAANFLANGAYTALVDGTETELAISCCPIAGGQRLVIEIVSRPTAAMDLSQLGLAEADAAALRRIILRGQGLVLVSGPPRMGKGVTVDALAANINTSRGDVVSIVRRGREGVARLPTLLAGGDGGPSLSDAVGFIARQDPDAIVIPEIRDAATCSAALCAAERGLVIASVLARDGAEALAMLMEAEDNRWALAWNLRAIISRMLVRTLCPACKAPVEASAELQEWLGSQGAHANLNLQGPNGCAQCLSSGYSGRAGVFGAIFNTSDLAAVIRKGATAPAVIDAANKLRVGTSLRQSLLALLREGTTSQDEVLRIGLWTS